MTLHVTLPDGSPLELDDGATVRDAAAAIGPRLAKAAIAGRVTAAADPDVTLLVDAAAPLHDGDTIAIVTLKGDDPDAVDIQRHSASHVMAQAIVRLFPGAKYAIGPTIENGFYYDLQLPEPIAEADLARIEKEMAKIVSQNLPVERYELPVDEALAVFGAGEPGTGASGLPLGLDQPFKVELIEDLVTAAEATGDEVPTISVYRQGEFVDLCRGPHLPSTNKLGNGTFKLTSLAGAYWRGDEKNPMLTRVYGTAFPSKEELAAYLEALELARQRDHRRIGRDLDLFSFHEEGPGFPFFHPKGMRLWNAMVDFWRAEHVRAGYEEISTPVILRRELWERSGHWDNYKENMYFTQIDDQPYAVKPMNCPGGLLIYKSRRRSYRDLPLRMAELGRVHRHEMSGVLHGLFRVRYFTQDDAHIYCTPEQLEEEVLGVVRFMQHIYAAFGFSDVKIELSTRPDKSIGSDEVWELAEGVLARVLEGEGIDVRAQPRRRRLLRPQDRLPHPRRHGPHLAVRHHPGRLRHAGAAGHHLHRGRQRRAPAGHDPPRAAGQHRALHGHPARALRRQPADLARAGAGPGAADRRPPRRVRASVMRAVRAAGAGSGADAPVTIHADVDDRGESIGKRIRDAQLQKVPYILVVGDREVEQGAVGVRERGEDKGARPLAEFVDDLVAEVRERRLPA